MDNISLPISLENRQLNYQQFLHVTATDIDLTVVHVAYIQFALLHIPAILIHGETLMLETWGYWVTPAHVIGLWDAHLDKRFHTPVEPRAGDAHPQT
jgi:hypothetical protein